MSFAKKKTCKLPQNSSNMFDSAIAYQKHKCINVIKHHNKIQRDMSRKHQIKLSIHFQLNIFYTKKQVN